jgi:type III restriction enzyme
LQFIIIIEASSINYYPDFIIRLTNGEYLILEIKGQDNQQHQIKRAFLKQWMTVVNKCGSFGEWHEVSHIIHQIYKKNF